MGTLKEIKRSVWITLKMQLYLSIPTYHVDKVRQKEREQKLNLYCIEWSVNDSRQIVICTYRYSYIIPLL